jgi:DNA replication protein DnaC
MMTADKCQTILEKRIRYYLKADKYPNYCLMHDYDALYLHEGDWVDARGWTTRELVAAKPPATGTRAERLEALYAYCFPRWNRHDSARQARQKKEDNDLRAAALERWAKYGPPARYAWRDLESLDLETDEQRVIVDKVAAFPERVETDPGALFDVLALLGPPGTRKTQLAASWLRAWVIDACADGQFVNAGQMVADARDADAVARYCAVEYLVIDDIGADPNDAGVMVTVLDARLGNNLTTVITSNATPAELEDIYGPRGFSRLMCNALVLKMTGRDWRRDPPAANVQKPTGGG